MKPAEANFLRYRFEGVDQLTRHLHLVAGRALFFFRDSSLSLELGQRVVVEFAFTGSVQVTTAHGRVLRRVETANDQGSWLEFPDTRLAEQIARGPQSIGRRNQRRLGCELMVELIASHKPVAGRMLDASLAGARIRGTTGLPPRAVVQIRIIGASPPIPVELGRAEVVHAGPGGEIGIRFVRADPVTRVASANLYAALQQAWASAPEALHLPTCCRDGVVLDPPLPPMMASL